MTTSNNKNSSLSNDTCTRFSSLADAKENARTKSIKDIARFVIKAGDYFFSSTTADIQKYEKLLFTYRYGQLVKNSITDETIDAQ